MISPLVVGIVRPVGMPFMAIALVVALWFFDRPAKPGPVTATNTG